MMRVLLVGLGCVGALMGALRAEELAVNHQATLSVTVEDGQTLEQADNVNVFSGGTLCKDGAGTWRVSSAKMQIAPGGTVVVCEGKTTLTDGTAVAVAKPTDVLARAAFWVAADVNVVATNTMSGASVAAIWFDARETVGEDGTVATTNYPFAWPAWDAKKTTAELYGVPPAVTRTEDGRAAVYFGKYGSSQAMRWKAATGGNLDLVGIRQVFLVYSISNSHGFTIGSKNNAFADFHIGSTGGGIDSSYWTPFGGDSVAICSGSRTSVNGQLINGFRTAVGVGTRLVDVELLNRGGCGAYFFNDRDIGGRCGGDYLHEAVLFTNQLAAVEIGRIRAYLMDKWSIARAKPGLREVNFVLGEGGRTGEHVR